MPCFFHLRRIFRGTIRFFLSYCFFVSRTYTSYLTVVLFPPGSIWRPRKQIPSAYTAVTFVVTFLRFSLNHAKDILESKHAFNDDFS
jgi:hypothetical protein